MSEVVVVYGFQYNARPLPSSVGRNRTLDNRVHVLLQVEVVIEYTLLIKKIETPRSL